MSVVYTAKQFLSGRRCKTTTDLNTEVNNDKNNTSMTVTTRSQLVTNLVS